MKQLERLGFVERQGRRLSLVRAKALLDAWAGSRSGSPVDLPARFDLPVDDPLEGLRQSGALRLPRSGEGSSDSGPRHAVGLFAAARLHGVGHVRGAPAHLLHEGPSPANLAALGLELVAGGQPFDLLVCRPVDVECAFRGVVEREGLPVADGFECWLDLVRHPARGEERAAELARAMGGRRVSSVDGADGYLEFIAPRSGSGQRRDGTAVESVHSRGVVAEPLPDVDLLQHAPWTAKLEPDVELSVAGATSPIRGLSATSRSARSRIGQRRHPRPVPADE